MPTVAWSLCRLLLCAAPLAGAAAAHAQPVDPLPPPPATVRGVVVSEPEVQVRYELQAPQDGQQGRAVLQGEVEAGESRLRTQVRFDPGAASGTPGGVDVSWELPAPGPLRGLTLGDGYTSGAAWSAPARLTGVRLGRGQSLRAPLRPDAPPTAMPAFTQSPAGTAWGGAWRANAHQLAPGAAPMAAPTPGDPQPLQAGASDYEVQFGRLREGWDSVERRYLGPYGAAAYRAGLGHGLTAEARAEWSATQTAHGLELLHDMGGGVSLQAMTAQSVGTEVGTDAGGQRWGAGLVVPGEHGRTRLLYGAADRDFRSATGGAEARRGLRLETTFKLWRATADASISRRLAWDATAPESSIALGSSVDLTGTVKMRLDVARTAGAVSEWRTGVSLALPFQ